MTDETTLFNMFDERKEEETKTCKECGRELPMSMFPVGSTDGKAHPQSYCKECYAERTRRYSLNIENNFKQKSWQTNNRAEQKITAEALKTSFINQFGNLKNEQMCPLCGKLMMMCESDSKYNSISVDHIKPLSCGGENTIKNIQWICYQCNDEKSSKYNNPEWYEGSMFDTPGSV